MSLLSCLEVFVCRTCLCHNCSEEQKLEFKRGEDLLEESENFYCLGDMISCYCEASEAVCARIGGGWCVEEVQRVKWCVSQEAEFIFKATGKYLSVLC